MFLDSYVTEIRSLETALLKAHGRLAAEADEEALHDLRIAVRRIRSLIAPLRSLPENQALREAATEVGRLTTPTRDLEVLIAELHQRGEHALAQARLPQLEVQHRQIVEAPQLTRLFNQLQQWPAAFQASGLGGDSRKLKRTIRKALDRQVGKLHKALDDADFDRHRLRILVKRTRYLTDAFPSLSPLSSKATKSLKKAQAALGAWHDHYQWLLRSQQESDLQVLEPAWEEAAEQELAEAETLLRKLAKVLPNHKKKRSGKKAKKRQ